MKLNKSQKSELLPNSKHMYTASPEYESNIIIIYFCINKESSFEIHSSELVISCKNINIKIENLLEIMSLSLLDRSLWKLLLLLGYVAVAVGRFFCLWIMPNMWQKILPFSEHPQPRGNMLIQNVGNHPPIRTLSHPRIITQLWELHSLIKSIFPQLCLSQNLLCAVTL